MLFHIFCNDMLDFLKIENCYHAHIEQENDNVATHFDGFVSAWWVVPQGSGHKYSWQARGWKVVASVGTSLFFVLFSYLLTYLAY